MANRLRNRMIGLGAALAGLAGPAASAQLTNPAQPSALECAAVFSVLAVDARQSDGAGSDRERSALRLYSNALRRSVLEAQADTLASARKIAGENSSRLIGLLETDAGVEQFSIALKACIARHS
jgi:hypothetical protein